jgi:restriction system protein
MKAWKVMAGSQSSLADLCFAEGFVGVDYGIKADLTGSLSEGEDSFRAHWRQHLLDLAPEKGLQSAGVRAGQVWLLSSAVTVGDLVVTPAGNPSAFRIGTVTSGYWHSADSPLPHRRSVEWSPQSFDASMLSAPLPRFGASICSVDGHLDDLRRLQASGKPGAPIAVADKDVENPYEFATEKYLEDFLVQNWAATALGRTHDIYTVDGEVVGQQYPTSLGTIDILALSKDGQEFLVVELKRGTASDRVVGQILRYMGAVESELAAPGQTIQGVIIGADRDARIDSAIRYARNVSFLRYRIHFELEPGL